MPKIYTANDIVKECKKVKKSLGNRLKAKSKVDLKARKLLKSKFFDEAYLFADLKKNREMLADLLKVETRTVHKKLNGEYFFYKSELDALNNHFRLKSIGHQV